MVQCTGVNGESEMENSLENTYTEDSEKRKNSVYMLSQLAQLDKDHDEEWTTIEEHSLVKLILESFIDEDKREILNSVTDRSLTISEILKICKIPPTSGYRKINSLIESGLLEIEGLVTVEKNRKRTYRSLFKIVTVEINKDKITIKVKFTKKML
jgi:hypothetical protein